MIATAMLGAQSPNGFNFSVKIQAKSALEILVLAMPRPPVPMGLKGSRNMIAGGLRIKMLGRQNPQQGYVWTDGAKVQRVVVAELGHSQIQNRPLIIGSREPLTTPGIVDCLSNPPPPPRS
jgi:hypothetical protein